MLIWYLNGDPSKYAVIYCIQFKLLKSKLSSNSIMYTWPFFSYMYFDQRSKGFLKMQMLFSGW